MSAPTPIHVRLAAVDLVRLGYRRRHVARHYGVSDTAVKLWCQKAGLPPGRPGGRWIPLSVRRG